MMIEREFRLSSQHTFADVHTIVAEKSSVKLAAFVGLRLTERYGEPALRQDIDVFSRLALECLLIEAIQGWRQGLASNRGREAELFQNYLGSAYGMNPFEADSFYAGVRCGILHQGETTKQWRVELSGTPIDPLGRTVDVRALARDLMAAIHDLQHWISLRPWTETYPSDIADRVKTTMDCLKL